MGAGGATASGVDVRRFANGGVTLVAMHSAYRAPGTRTLELPVPPGAVAHGLGGTKLAQLPGRVSLQLDGAVPAILALSPAPLPGPLLSASLSGARLQVQAALDGPEVVGRAVEAVDGDEFGLELAAGDARLRVPRRPRDGPPPQGAVDVKRAARDDLGAGRHGAHHGDVAVEMQHRLAGAHGRVEDQGAGRRR